jgi:hypothetical protein
MSGEKQREDATGNSEYKTSHYRSRGNYPGSKAKMNFKKAYTLKT